jgi:guanosine-3',5'-bis(diphosphate) 3'-pyrophosphohydrolase
MNNTIEQVRSFAAKAHGSQRRKYRDEDYIMHLVRVMEMTSRFNSSLPVLAAALLHDTLEDTPVTKEDIRDFLRSVMGEPEADRTLELVVELTDVYTKAQYPQWNRRKRRAKEAERLSKVSTDAQTIKYADIIDNCVDIVKADADFASVFLRECKMLLNSMEGGDKELRKDAIAVVNDELNKLALTGSSGLWRTGESNP